MASAIPEFETSRRNTGAILAVRNQALYDAGAHTRRTVGWYAPTASANQGILANLTTLRDRSRATTRNNGYGKSVIDKLVTNIIGTGITPLSQVADPALRERIDALFLQWTDESDADGQLDFYGQQRLAVRTWLEGGEAFARLRQRLPSDGLSVSLQIQLLEPELCPHTHTVWGQRIRAGMRFNHIGRRVSYFFHPSRPEQDDYDPSRLVELAADDVCHLYDLTRAGQLRGLPHLTQALIALLELDKYADAQLLKQQLSNLLVGFLKRPPAIGAAEALHPLTGTEPEPAPANPDLRMIRLRPGAINELDPGEEMTWSDPPEARGFADFMRQHLYGVAAASNVPYEVFTGDMRGLNDRLIRVVLNEFRRAIQAWQHHIVVYQFCRRVWNAWIERAFLTGALPIPIDYLQNRERYRAVIWQPQDWPYIHPLQDVQADKEAVRCGFKSRRAVVSEHGDNAEAVDRENQIDNQRADDMGLRYDSDARHASNSAGTPSTGDADPAERGETDERAA